MVRPMTTRLLLAVTLALSLQPAFAAGTASPLDEKIFPPWQNGKNNDAVERGLEFTVPQVDVMADFHGRLDDPKLVLFVGGNYFFAMAPLVAAFETANPAYKGRIFWETIPPGLLVKQIKAGGTITSGNMTFTAKADAYFAGLAKVDSLIADGTLAGPAVPYVTNTLAIMVPKGNPAGVKSLADLGKPGIRLAMPNPAFEGIVRQIKASLAKTGGDSLANAVYETKVKDGSTVLTHIHHRQTPLFLMQGVAQAGVTWQSEAIFQEQAGNPIEHVAIPAAQNTTAIYAGAMVKDAPHPDAAKAWLAFIRSPEALKIFEGFGFKPYKSDHAEATPAPTPTPMPASTPAPAPAPAAKVQAAAYAPPPDSAIPDGPLGDSIKLGKAIFDDPSAHAGAYVGNKLKCSNCHLDSGRSDSAAPFGAAYVAYPAYRAKNGHVNTFAERLQGCFRYSMNGKAPPLGDKVLVALETYAAFLAKGAPVGVSLPHRGFPKVPAPPQPADFARGATVFADKCAACHGANGEGLVADGKAVYPALWGPESFNWGAGMESITNASAFIKANMPLGQGGSLTDQEAWDVATFVDSHDRPQDPRFNGDVAKTRALFHDSPMSMYGRTVNGAVLGASSPLSGPRTLP